jgi:hypothetical protein
MSITILPIANSDENNGNSSNDSPSNEEITVTIQYILNYVDSVALAQGKVDLFIPIP